MSIEHGYSNAVHTDEIRGYLILRMTGYVAICLQIRIESQNVRDPLFNMFTNVLLFYRFSHNEA